ncbi:GNAT superfamily N-acetyltransferase [Pedobacter cryoconitis]|uniref:GNAT superfamily N-acetyltransferase n=1 Tax=Pedobacter cryoconitis TaxID=188932 RepID=A0A7W8YTZ3_9SPHI|nr:GNAT family N-acetyltransferase [Pedobacter cryoconitis]MBB5621749.1 GNAT superfamily N-acetyltransferase [Pedobacter cryoconitis]MBB5644121.1 GNAT superfamily N-acetyltransferase [Pedobacter cryoconitis]
MNKESISEAIVLEVAATDLHFNQILALQQENLYSAISAAQQQQQGFVFAEHNLALLKKMAGHLPQVIATFNNRVIGYNLAMHVSLRNELSSLIPMFNEFERCRYRGELLGSYNYMVGGQVCVHRDFRGQGLLNRLYQETKSKVGELYQLCVTEISTRNINSLKVHQRMGFEVIGTYRDEKELWNVVAWNLGE